MKLLSVRDLRGKSAQVWRELPAEKEMIVTSNGRPIAVLTAVNESNLEKTIAAWRQARVLQAITDIQMESTRQGKRSITLNEIESEIKDVRRKRHLEQP